MRMVALDLLVVVLVTATLSYMENVGSIIVTGVSFAAALCYFGETYFKRNEPDLKIEVQQIRQEVKELTERIDKYIIGGLNPDVVAVEVPAGRTHHLLLKKIRLCPQRTHPQLKKI
ncbi:hypothetical protein OROMI_027009 [Orobanche minor]